MQHQIEVMKKNRELVGMNRREFSEYMNIPLRTLEEWEAGRRKMPDYVLRLITYYISMEQLMKNRGIKVEEDLYEQNE
ncbi:MAG: XRE family transcriptional regulator [Lachnospiraceae bacterium]|nr:XRE family transcriptional regulator [Lachnospiraceae bacterium]